MRYYVKMTIISVPKGKPIMVFACNDTIFCTTVFNKFCPFFWFKVRCGKTTQLLKVVFMGEIFIVKRPRFTYTVYGVNPPVYKNTQFGIFKPLHFIMICCFENTRLCLLCFDTN